ncbi:hypothetical protein LMTR13_08675 [Bradyrhizobium icense]|uniref:Uncharacterized protein n=1 Tax=Bradyrhizobium icense TaxID=1274631 RepID=A0A1B1UBU9_9BRAD|nr:hypothetical protein LMTR13_08675 [Bradyrhizobium icense]
MLCALLVYHWQGEPEAQVVSCQQPTESGWTGCKGALDQAKAAQVQKQLGLVDCSRALIIA